MYRGGKHQGYDLMKRIC